MRDSVVVIGAGMMGSGIAAMSAIAGHKTILVDHKEKNIIRGRAKAEECIDIRLANGLDTKEEAERAKTLIETTLDRDGACERAFIVIEAIVENLEIKQEMFKELDEILPAEVPICSDTSGLRISDISAKCHVHPERTVTSHFWLPPHLIPLVEVVIGERTDPKVAEQVRDELKKWKKAPVLVKRDEPGQLLGKIFQAVIRESINIVASGLASAEDVDTAIGKGIGMRLAEWGPLEHLDAIGLQLGLSVQDSVNPTICDAHEANPYLRALVENGHTGAKAGQGFYDWSNMDLEKEMKKRDAFIIAAIKATTEIEKENSGRD